MRRRQKGIERGEAGVEAVDGVLAEAFQRGVDEGRVDVEAGGVLCGEDLAERRRDADAPFAIERPQYRQHERQAGHETGIPQCPEGALAATADMASDEPLGQSGIAWDGTEGQSNNVGN